MAQQQRVKHKKPQRYAGYDKCRKARWHNPLGIGEREVAAHQQKQSDNRKMRKLGAVVADAAPSDRTVSQHEYAGGGEAGGAHQCRRNVFDGDANAEVSRSPEKVHQPEGEDDTPPVLTLRISHRSSATDRWGRIALAYQTRRERLAMQCFGVSY